MNSPPSRRYSLRMLDPKIIIANPDAVREAARKKHIKFDVEHFIEVDEKRKALLQNYEGLRARNSKENTKEIAALKGEEKEKAIQEMKVMKEQEKIATEHLRAIELEWRGLLLRAPGLISPDAPEGKNHTENI